MCSDIVDWYFQAILFEVITSFCANFIQASSSAYASHISKINLSILDT